MAKNGYDDDDLEAAAMAGFVVGSMAGGGGVSSGGGGGDGGEGAGCVLFLIIVACVFWGWRTVFGIALYAAAIILSVILGYKALDIDVFSYLKSLVEKREKFSFKFKIGFYCFIAVLIDLGLGSGIVSAVAPHLKGFPVTVWNVIVGELLFAGEIEGICYSFTKKKNEKIRKAKAEIEAKRTRELKARAKIRRLDDIDEPDDQ